MIKTIRFETYDGEAHKITVALTRREDGTMGARTIDSLLMTQDLNDFRVKLWNQGVDMLESMIIVQACHGVNIEDAGYVEGIRCYVTSLRNRLF